MKEGNGERQRIKFCDYAVALADGVEDCCKVVEDYAFGTGAVDSHRVRNALQILADLRRLVPEFIGHLTRIESGDMTPEQARALT